MNNSETGSLTNFGTILGSFRTRAVAFYPIWRGSATHALILAASTSPSSCCLCRRRKQKSERSLMMEITTNQILTCAAQETLVPFTRVRDYKCNSTNITFMYLLVKLRFPQRRQIKCCATEKGTTCYSSLFTYSFTIYHLIDIFFWELYLILLKHDRNYT